MLVLSRHCHDTVTIRPGAQFMDKALGLLIAEGLDPIALMNASKVLSTIVDAGLLTVVASVEAIRGDKVRLGFEASEALAIHRSELTNFQR